jgi:hypothetical protein
MPRPPKAEPPAAPTPPPVVHANAIYSASDVQQIVKGSKSLIRREVRLGRLRVSRRGGRHFFLGEWVLEWLRSGELKPKPAD